MPPGKRAPTLTPRIGAAPTLRDAVAQVIDELDAGRLRVAEKSGGEWITHQWIKKAVLLSFRLADNAAMGSTRAERVPFRFYDKVADQVRGLRRSTRSRSPACASCRRPSRGAAPISRRTSC